MGEEAEEIPRKQQKCKHTEVEKEDWHDVVVKQTLSEERTGQLGTGAAQAWPGAGVPGRRALRHPHRDALWGGPSPAHRRVLCTMDLHTAQRPCAGPRPWPGEAPDTGRRCRRCGLAWLGLAALPWGRWCGKLQTRLA